MQSLFRILDRVADPCHGIACINTSCTQRVPLRRADLRRLTLITIFRSLMVAAILFGCGSLVALRIHAQGITRNLPMETLNTKIDYQKWQIDELLKNDADKGVRIAHLENTVATMQGIYIGLSAILAVLQVLLLVSQRKQ